MNRANFETFYAQNSGLIYKIARRAYLRMIAIGAAIEFDDLAQDLTVTFIRAYDTFDESRGVKFSTYFMRCALNCVNPIARRFETERIELGIRSVEELDMTSGEGGLSVAERIASDDLTPEQTAEWNGIIERMETQLSPLASLILRWLVEPPDFLEREQCAQCAHAEYARSRGIERRAMPPSVTFVARVLKRVWNVPAAQMRVALRQITQFRRGLA
jgi:RNA polymerase sigma factor (sigma-70 family)